MREQLDPALLALQREYLASLPDRLDELKTDIEAMARQSPGAEASLKARLHRLAGSGGSFGFPELSAVAREGERWLAANPNSTNAVPLLSLVERLAMTAYAAETQLAAAETGDRPAVIPRALLVMRPTPQRERIAQELRDAGYEVRFGAREDHPAALPSEQLPHLVIIGGEAGDGDLSAVASAWTNSPDRRPGAVVLVETLRPVDRLRAIASGVDAVFPAEQVEQKLPRYARTFARIGPPPSSVVLVEHDEERARHIAAALDSANIRVTRAPRNQPITEVLDRESPDLLLLNSKPVDASPVAMVRVIRQDPRYHLLPVVLLGEDDIGDRVSALKAGADDFVSVSADSALLVQTVVARAARGRRIRELVHRDGLTGLLNQATLMAELESAVEFSQRYAEPLAFVLFELDGFKAVSQRLGPRAADEVLLHVAGVFRSNVRASDVIGRYGAEAFGMLLRGANASGATVLARNLHRVLGGQPARTSVGDAVPVQVSVGTAVFPRDGTTAAELAQAADRALRSKK